MKPIEGMTQAQADEMLVIMWVALSHLVGTWWFAIICWLFAGPAFVRVLDGRRTAVQAIRKATRTSTEDYL